jgi:hypothetical protein
MFGFISILFIIFIYLFYASWPTIANAALSEGVCAAKMSRCVKAKTVISDYYYCSQ